MPASSSRVDRHQVQRKKRARRAQEPATTRYWSEYDNPEGDHGDDSYYLYIDNEMQRWPAQLWARAQDTFEWLKISDRRPLLSPHMSDTNESSDDEAVTASYGTLHPAENSRLMHDRRSEKAMSRLTVVAFLSASVLIISACVLSVVGRRKMAALVRGGTALSTVSGLALVVVANASLLRDAQTLKWYVWAGAGCLTSAIVIVSGFLLVQMVLY